MIMYEITIKRGRQHFFDQGVTWTIVETQDGFVVESHWRSLWHGGSTCHGMFASDALAEKFILEKVKRDREEKLAREKKKDLEEAARLIKKWE